MPVIDHPLFLGGLALFFAGIVGFKLSALVGPAPSLNHSIPAVTWVGLQASAVAVMIAAVTWVSAVAGLPSGVDVWTQHEFAAWGPGHVLQVANVSAMLAMWLWLLDRATGAPVISVRTARILFLVLVLPHFALPLLTARGTLDTLYHSGATWLMRWTIFPVLVTMTFLSWRHLRRHRSKITAMIGRTASMGVKASIGLTLLGMTCLLYTSPSPRDRG